MKAWRWRPLIRRKRLLAFLEDQRAKPIPEDARLWVDQMIRNLEGGMSLSLPAEWLEAE